MLGHLHLNSHLCCVLKELLKGYGDGKINRFEVLHSLVKGLCFRLKTFVIEII